MKFLRIIKNAYVPDTKLLWTKYTDKCSLILFFWALQIVSKLTFVQKEAIIASWIALHALIALMVYLVVRREQSPSRIAIVLVTFYLFWTTFLILVIPI